MNYDVFISYSRKDTAVADRVCAAFDKAGISYFIDRQGIGGGMEFPRVLAEAILGCRKFLFLASANSYESKFTNSEITFAFNKKPKDSIIPYRIDRSEMPLELEFVFCDIDWRNIGEHPVETVLVRDILQMLGRPVAQSAKTATSSATRNITRQPAPQQRAKTYKAGGYCNAATSTWVAIVSTLLIAIGCQSDILLRSASTTGPYNVGDYYNENGREGVVFEVDATGRHGKVVGMKQSSERLQWCTKEECDKGLTGADDKTDGMQNQRKIMSIDGWREKYPAFAWCAAQGDGWYLPAIEELKRFTLDDNVHDAVHRTLLQHGGDAIFNKGKIEWYWSSSEYDSRCAWYVNIGSGYAGDLREYYHFCVRTVSAF